MNSVPVLPKGRFWEMISFEFHLKNRHEETRNREISVIWCISAEMLCQFFDMFLRLCVVFLKPLTSRIIVFYAEHNPYGLQSPIVSSLAFGAFGSSTKEPPQDPHTSNSVRAYFALYFPCSVTAESSFFRLLFLLASSACTKLKVSRSMMAGWLLLWCCSSLLSIEVRC